MVKIAKSKIILFIVLIIFIMTVILAYINFLKFNTYSENNKGELVSSNGMTYKFDWQLTRKYSDGKLKTNRVIGKLKDTNIVEFYLIGPRIVKLKNYNGNQIFLLQGLMLQEVYQEER